MSRSLSRPLAMLLLTSLAFGALALAGLGLAASIAEGAPRAPEALPDTIRLGVEDAVRRAAQYAIPARIAGQTVRAARGRVLEAASVALPQIEGTITYNRRFDSIFREAGADTGIAALFANSPFGSVHQWSVDLTATQLVWSGGRVGAAFAAARAYRRSAIAAEQQVASDVVLDARGAYWQAASAARVLAIAESSLALARAQLAQVDRMYRQGARAEYDLLRAQVDAANAEPTVVAARNAVELAQLDLKRTLAIPLDRVLVLTSPLAFANDEVPVVDDPAIDGRGRAALAQAQADVEVRRHALRVERASRWPQLSVSGTMSHQAFPSDGHPDRDLFRRNLEASAKLEFPLFLGGRTFGAVQRATAEWRQAQLTLEDTRQGVDLDVARARRDVERALADLAARRGTAGLARRTYRLAQSRYANGLGTQLEVTDARVGAATAESNEVLAIRDYLVALAALEHAVGRPVHTQLKSLDDLSSDLQEVNR